MAKKDPNNAYGTKAARAKAMLDVARDAEFRDSRSLSDPMNSIEEFNDAYPRSQKTAQIRNRIQNEAGRPGVMGDYYAKQMTPKVKNEMVKQGDAQRKRLVEKYAKEAPKKMAKGGTASKRADGCATKGKTKGRFV
jgi:hypothetical protein